MDVLVWVFFETTEPRRWKDLSINFPNIFYLDYFAATTLLLQRDFEIKFPNLFYFDFFKQLHCSIGRVVGQIIIQYFIFFNPICQTHRQFNAG